VGRRYDDNQNSLIVTQFYQEIVRCVVRGIYGVLSGHRDRYQITVTAVVHEAQVEHYLYFQKAVGNTQQRIPRRDHKASFLILCIYSPTGMLLYCTYCYNNVIICEEFFYSNAACICVKFVEYSVTASCHVCNC
jgi:hypothetical protein